MASSIDELIARVILEASRDRTYGRPVNIPHDGGRGAGQGVGGPRNRGVPGYPVPPEMRNRGDADSSNGLEVLEVRKPAKSIKHLDDLKPDEFMSFLRKYSDPSSHGLDVTEKVDGSANLTIGVDLDGLWTRTKNGTKKHSPSEYPTTSKYRAVRAAAEAIDSAKLKLLGAWPHALDKGVMVADILYGNVPNTVRYGNNAIIVHTVLRGDGTPWGPAMSRKFVDCLSRSIGDLDGWKFGHVDSIDPSEVHVDVSERLREIEETYLKLGVDEGSLEKFRALQREIKETMLEKVRGRPSSYGPPDGSIEGLVFRDLESGALTKLVDRDYFTRLNSYYWQWRQLLERGAKIDDKWITGIMQELRNSLADHVLGVPIAKSQQFISSLKRFANSIDYPENIVTPDQMTIYAIARWVQDYSTTGDDVITSFIHDVMRAKQRFQEVNSEWKQFCASPMKINLRGQDHSYPQEIIERTDEAFKEFESTLDDISRGVEQISQMRTQLGQKVALIKLIMGPRIDRLHEHVGLRDRSPTDLSGRHDIRSNLDEVVSLNDPPPSDQYSDELRHVWKLRDRVERRLGTTLAGANNLGEGSQGVALGLTDGTVLKITRDWSEAKAERRLIGEESPHIARIYDVFEFPGKPIFGIWQERLDPLSPDEKKKIDTMFSRLDVILKNKFGHEMIDGDSWSKIAEALGTVHGDLLSQLETIDFSRMLTELDGFGIKFSDFHSGNIMKRNGGYVVLDLGYSKSVGTAPDVLENIVRDVVIEALEGSRNPSADSIGATIGRFQPFHSGHAKIIRDLANKFTKTIIFVAGQRTDSRNPFDSDLRLEMMKLSLPDVYEKLEIYPALIGGKGTGYIPGLLEYVAESGQSSVQPTSAVNVLVGDDRVDAVRRQIEHNIQHQSEPGHFKGMLNVSSISRMDDESNVTSGTKIRDALLRNDRASVESMLDPHLVGSPKFESLYERMRSSLIKREMIESVLNEIGMGASETGVGNMHSGDWGSSAWSRAWLADDEGDAESVYQRMLGSPNRMLPMNNPGQPNACLPSLNGSAEEQEDEHENPRDPTDLGESIVNGIISSFRGR